MPPRVTTTQRRRMAKPMMASIMSILVLEGIGLFQLGLERKSVGDCDGFARRQPTHDLDLVVILAAGAYLPCRKAAGIAYKQRRRALDGLQRVARYDHIRRRVAERNFRCHERAGLPAVIGIRKAGD